MEGGGAPTYYVRPTRFTARVDSREEMEPYLAQATPEDAADATTCCRCHQPMYGERVSVAVVLAAVPERFVLTLAIVCGGCVRIPPTEELNADDEVVCMTSDNAMRAVLGRFLVYAAQRVWMTNKHDTDELARRLFICFDEERAAFLRALGDLRDACGLCMATPKEAPLLRCPGCLYATYCNAECHELHVAEHRELCDTLRTRSFFLETEGGRVQ